MPEQLTFVDRRLPDYSVLTDLSPFLWCILILRVTLSWIPAVLPSVLILLVGYLFLDHLRPGNVAGEWLSIVVPAAIAFLLLAFLWNARRTHHKRTIKAESPGFVILEDAGFLQGSRTTDEFGTGPHVVDLSATPAEELPPRLRNNPPRAKQYDITIVQDGERIVLSRSVLSQPKADQRRAEIQAFLDQGAGAVTPPSDTNGTLSL